MSNLPTTFAERVRERITEQIADLIPADDLTKLIEIRIAEFRQKELPGLIDSCIRDRLKESIIAAFAKPEHQQQWDGHGSYGASKAVSDLIEKNAPRILSAMIGGAVQQAIYTLNNGRGF